MSFNFAKEKSCLTIFAVNPLQGVMRNLLVEGCNETVGVHKYRLWFYMSCDSAGARHCWPYLPDATATHTKGNTDFGDRVYIWFENMHVFFMLKWCIMLSGKCSS